MGGSKNIYHKNKLIAVVIRKNVNIKNGISFFTEPADSLQLAHHKYSHKRITNIHSNNVIEPLILTEKQKYIYIIKGSAKVTLTMKNKKIQKSVLLKKGDGIIIRDVYHKVEFSKNSGAIEIKQGPYEG